MTVKSAKKEANVRKTDEATACAASEPSRVGSLDLIHVCPLSWGGVQRLTKKKGTDSKNENSFQPMLTSLPCEGAHFSCTGALSVSAPTTKPPTPTITSAKRHPFRMSGRS